MDKTPVMSYWNNRTVLVTGACGFVGSWLVDLLLEANASVVAFVLTPDPQSQLFRSGNAQRCTVVQGDLRERGHIERALNEHDCDSVFHLGAQTLVGPANRAPLETWESNVRGTYLLLEACRQLSGLVRTIVIASSDKAYGSATTLPYSEDTPLQGLHPYDCSKSCTDMIAQVYANTYKLPLVIARCGNIYGGGDLNWSRIVPGTIRWVLRGEHPILRSDGTFLRDYLYAKDAADAYMAMGEAIETKGLAGRAFNFGPGSPHTVLQIVEAITRLMNRTDLTPIIEATARAEIQDQYLDSTAAGQVLGWRPKWSLEAGLAASIEWYSAFLHERDGNVI